MTAPAPLRRGPLIAVLILLALLLAGAAALPWWLDRPAPIPAGTPTVVPELTGPPFVSAAPG